MYIISGQYRNRKLMTPKGIKTRPTASHLREALFNICQAYIENAHFLDLFAGSGAIGLEALSRGAKSTTFIENQRDAIHCIKQNIDLLHVQEQCTLLPGDVFRMLNKLQQQKQQFDIIFADPPYRSLSQSHSTSESIIRWIDENALLAPNGILFIEEAFEHQPQIHDLKTLKFKNSRRVSSAALQQYIM